MVRLYKALHETGVSMEIIPAKDIYEAMIVFRHKGSCHRTWYNLDRLDEEAVIRDLYQFKHHIDCIDEILVSGLGRV